MWESHQSINVVLAGEAEADDLETKFCRECEEVKSFVGRSHCVCCVS